MPAQVTNAPQRTEAQLFLKNLREETGPAHEALEAHPISQSITSSGITAAEYRRYLQVMQRVVEGLENLLTPILKDVLPDIDARIKQGWLAEDLEKEGRENSYPPFHFSADERDVAYALGAFYVLEGSTLGGRVILKGLPASLDVPTRYFEGYGAQTGPMWQSFSSTLGNAASAATEQHIIRGAVDTFAAIHSYFNLCQAHEAAGHCQS